MEADDASAFEKTELSGEDFAGAGEFGARGESEEAQTRDYYGEGFRPASSADRRSARQLWLISYSDFMTILMIFFLVMYGYMLLVKAQSAPRRRPGDPFSISITQLKNDLGRQVEVRTNGKRTTIALTDSVFFPSGSAALAKEAGTTLDQLAKSIKLVRGQVIVEGHTDNVPIRTARFRSNWELSAARAFSVIRALTERGVPPERLAAWGFGEYRPVAPNDREADREKNRRIEIVILGDDTKN